MLLANIDCSIYFAQHTERLVHNCYLPSNLVHHIVNIMARNLCQLLKRIFKINPVKMKHKYKKIPLIHKDNETIFP
jgi:hypothetical protein